MKHSHLHVPSNFGPQSIQEYQHRKASISPWKFVSNPDRAADAISSASDSNKHRSQPICRWAIFFNSFNPMHCEKIRSKMILHILLWVHTSGQRRTFRYIFALIVWLPSNPFDIFNINIVRWQLDCKQNARLK